MPISIPRLTQRRQMAAATAVRSHFSNMPDRPQPSDDGIVMVEAMEVILEQVDLGGLRSAPCCTSCGRYSPRADTIWMMDVEVIIPRRSSIVPPHRRFARDRNNGARQAL